jgi:hypothetical protein
LSQKPSATAHGLRSDRSSGQQFPAR